jgi:glycosyltransferase involved in cell wall biosynthesis
MTPEERSIGFLVPSYQGQPGVQELSRQTALGLRPRKAYVELAGLLGAEVIDTEYLDTRASAPARALARRISLPAGQVAEAFLRRDRYRTICAWGDKQGVPLASLYKLIRSHHDVVLVSDWLSRPKKAVFVRPLRVHTHLRAIINSSSVQNRNLATRLRVPAHKLHHVPLPVDERFWQPAPLPTEDFICSVGLEARDYSTLLKAVRGLEVGVQLAVGTIVLSVGRTGGALSASASTDPAPFDLLRGTFGYRLFRAWQRELAAGGLPPNVRLAQQLNPQELRRLYARSRFVVVPLHDVDSDCGMSTITEAMAMGKALVLTRTRGQVDVVRDGEQGIYVKPGDAAGLRAAIEHLVANPQEADRMGRAGRALVEERHGLDDHVRRLADLLQPGGPARDPGPRRTNVL